MLSESNDGTLTYIPPSKEDIDNARKLADEKFKGFSDDQVKLLRHQAKHNLSFLAYGVLGYTKTDSGLHRDLAQWLHNTITAQYRMVLLPRSHYKSTICTITDGIQICLTDDLKTAPYPRNLGPNCRVLERSVGSVAPGDSAGPGRSADASARRARIAAEHRQQPFVGELSARDAARIAYARSPRVHRSARSRREAPVLQRFELAD